MRCPRMDKCPCSHGWREGTDVQGWTSVPVAKRKSGSAEPLKDNLILTLVVSIVVSAVVFVTIALLVIFMIIRRPVIRTDYILKFLIHFCFSE